jgi:hypothetical protein
MSKKFLTVILFIFFANAVFSQSTQEFSKENFSKKDLTNQFLNQKSEVKDLQITSADKKSPGLALILSLLLPGAGHFYIDRMDVGKYFVIAEGASWIGLAGMNLYGDALQEDYRTYSVENAGVNKTGKDKDYFTNVGNFNSVYEYNNEKLLTGEYSLIYDVNTNFWNWNSMENRFNYENQRRKSERVYNTRIVFGTALIVNRVVSALSALVLANKVNSGTTLNIQPEVIQKEYRIDGLKLNISKNF